MLKIVVFDGGRGGEVVANYLQEELQVVEVIPEIDWENAPYEDKRPDEICTLAVSLLRKYIGKVDLIVLGGYTAALALEDLQEKYPEQKFVSVGVNYFRVLQGMTYPDRVTVMMNQSLMETKLCEDMRDNLPYSNISVPDSRGWESLTNEGKLSYEVLMAELAPYFRTADQPPSASKIDQNRPLAEVILDKKDRLSYASATSEVWPPEKKLRSDVVLILNTNFWEIRSAFEEVFGYRVKVMDFRQKLLHDVCIALNLLGADGERSK